MSCNNFVERGRELSTLLRQNAKVELFQRLIKHHNIKTYAGVEVYFQVSF
jgi:hypothetical protein